MNSLKSPTTSCLKCLANLFHLHELGFLGRKFRSRRHGSVLTQLKPVVCDDMLAWFNQFSTSCSSVNYSLSYRWCAVIVSCDSMSTNWHSRHTIMSRVRVHPPVDFKRVRKLVDASNQDWVRITWKANKQSARRCKRHHRTTGSADFSVRFAL